MPTKGNIFYKFKSEKKFRELNYDLPTLVSHIRTKLRDILDIGEDMEILVTLSDKNGRVSNVYLSDYELIKDGTYLNAVRLPRELAKPLHEAANSRIKNKPLSSTNTMTAVSISNNSISVKNNSTDLSIINTTASPATSSKSLDNNSSVDSYLENILTKGSKIGGNLSATHTGESNIDYRENIANSNTKNLNDMSEDAAILSVMQQHGEKFKQTAAQRSEILEQINQRNCSRNISSIGSRHNSINYSGTNYSVSTSYRSEPYKKSCNSITTLNSNGTHSTITNQHSTSGVSSILNGYGYKNITTNSSTDVPADYICHMCGERGHHIRVCPKVNEGVSQKKIRPATGIPRSFLRAINFDEEGRLYSEVYCLPDGTFAVLKDAKQLSSTAFLTRTVEDTIGKHMGKSKEDTGLVRNSLTCPICTRLFRYAVLTPCCGETYCQECIINFIRNHTDVASGISPNTIKGQCPHCSTIISIADLEPNNPIRKSVNVALGLQPS